MSDTEFLTHIISEICTFAVKNEMEPDDTLKKISESILELLKISTFDGWEGDEDEW